MFTCTNCKKIFKFNSKYKAHKNKKNPCIADLEQHVCLYCDKEFKFKSKLDVHQLTKGCLNNKTKYENYNNTNTNNSEGSHNNTIIGNHNSLLQNIINLTIKINSFKDSTLGHLDKAEIENIIYQYYSSYFNKKPCRTMTEDIVLKMIDAIVMILDKINFNLDIKNNHNCRILLMLPNQINKLYEYLILEINPETNVIQWRSLKYNEFIIEIMILLKNINNQLNIKDLDKFIEYLDINLLKDEKNNVELQPFIEERLHKLYIKYNVKQGIIPDLQYSNNNRVIDKDLNLRSQIKEYKTYRAKECTLSNGYEPNIIDSKV